MSNPEQELNNLDIPKDTVPEFSESREKAVETTPQPRKSILHQLSVSYFGDEKKMAVAWLTFITCYWSLVMWIPTLISLDFSTPGFGMYCVSLIAIFAEGASLYADKYPSGATKESPHSYDGRGRYSAIFLVLCIIIDVVGLAFEVLNRSPLTQDYFRFGCHLLALMWCSLFYYNRLLKENPQMAWGVFWEEWSDIALTIVVVLLLHNAYERKYHSAQNVCFKHGLCSTYWVVFMFQLAGWMLPMMLIEGWGAERHAVKVALHLFILDLCTNVPIIIVVIATNAYKLSPMIFADTLWKACGFIRSTSYFMVYYVWLRKGSKK